MSARAPRRAALGGLLLLAACGGAAPPAEPPSAGRRLYVTHCVACHQPHGEGLSGVQPPLAGQLRVEGDGDDIALSDGDRMAVDVGQHAHARPGLTDP